MANVILQLAVSLDGYIARTDGSVDFLGDMGESTTSMFEQFLAKIDVIVMGRSTYDQMLTFGDIPFQDKRIIVLSTRPLTKTYPHVEQQHIYPKDLVQTIDGTIWLFGGANVIETFLKDNLVDRLEVFTVSQVIGDGIPLFPKGLSLSQLKLVHVEQFGNNVLTVYENTSKD